MRRTPLTTVAAICVLLAVLTGCGSDPQPKFAKSASPTPSHSASVSPTPSVPVPPVMPAAAKKHTVAGAKAFTRYVWRVVNYSQATLDASTLRPLLSEGCPGCRGALGVIDRISKAHGTVHGGVYSVAGLHTTRLLAGKTVLIRVMYKLTSTRQVIDYPGQKKNDVYKAGTTTDQFDLSPRPTGWQVISWTVE